MKKLAVDADFFEIACEILKQIPYATLATADVEGKPWDTPVYTAFDKELNLYWSSHPESEHSKNVAAKDKGFIVIYNSTAAEGAGVGLYLDVRVQILDDHATVVEALKLLGTRRGRPFLNSEKFIENGPQRIYKAIPIRAWFNDADQDMDGDFIKDYRIKLEFKELAARL